MKMSYGIVTDYYVGAQAVVSYGSRKLQLAFADVYQSEVGRHKTLLVSVFWDYIDGFLPLAAFERGEIPEEAHDYVRRAFANTPITWREEELGFDNYFYIGVRETDSEPIEIMIESNTIKAKLDGNFVIRLPYNNLPEGHPLRSMGDRTFNLNSFELEFTKPTGKPVLGQPQVLLPDEIGMLRCPCTWHIFDPAYFNPDSLLQAWNSGFTIQKCECNTRTHATVLSGCMGINMAKPQFFPTLQMAAFRTIIPPEEWGNLADRMGERLIERLRSAGVPIFPSSLTTIGKSIF